MPTPKKKLKRRLLFFSGALLLALSVYIWKFLPIITGYAAKGMCSAIFLSGRNPADVHKNDLYFPFNLTSYRVDRADSSVSTSILGLARRRAVYRKGLGATLLSAVTEEQLRQQNFPLAPPPPCCQDTIDWPRGDRIRDTPVPGPDLQRLARVQDEAFRKWGTRALLIIYKRQIILERYAVGFSAQTPLPGWSMTKGLLNAELGIMVKQGRLDTAAPAPVKAWNDDNRKSITIAQLMHMTSGLHFFWFPAGPSDLTNMLFKEPDMGKFAAQLSLSHPPGTVWNYSDGSANILSGVVRRTLGDTLYYRYPYEELFYKIGMYHTVLEPDAEGNFVNSSYGYATARDWARFGLLYLNDGVFGGERILPEGWVKWSSAHSPSKWNYGALWWTEKDWFACEGFDGQYVYVVPSKQLVIVRLSLEKKFWPQGELVKEVMKAVP